MRARTHFAFSSSTTARISREAAERASAASSSDTGTLRVAEGRDLGRHLVCSCVQVSSSRGRSWGRPTSVVRTSLVAAEEDGGRPGTKSTMTSTPVKMAAGGTSVVRDVTDTKAGRAVVDFLAWRIGRGRSEAQIVRQFYVLLAKLFDKRPQLIDEFADGAEVAIENRSGGGRVVRGTPDNLFGSVVFEFKTSIASKRKRDEALEQLRRYVSILWSKEDPGRRIRYLCVAADGRRFRTYSAVPPQDGATPEPDEVELAEVERADWQTAPVGDVLDWVDRHFPKEKASDAHDGSDAAGFRTGEPRLPGGEGRPAAALGGGGAAGAFSTTLGPATSRSSAQACRAKTCSSGTPTSPAWRN